MVILEFTVPRLIPSCTEINTDIVLVGGYIGIKSEAFTASEIRIVFVAGILAELFFVALDIKLIKLSIEAIRECCFLVEDITVPVAPPVEILEVKEDACFFVTAPIVVLNTSCVVMSELCFFVTELLISVNISASIMEELCFFVEADNIEVKYSIDVK